ncbi:hypothetical protein ABQF35_25720 [Mycobacterium syngnathidarum]
MLLRGECVMRGYRNQGKRTPDAIVDEWLRTGDLVTVDDEGYVSTVDRKKELIINAMGKNMSPVAIESQLKAATPPIAHVVRSATTGRSTPHSSCSTPRPCGRG